MRPELQVKQWLGPVRGRHGWFAAFATADPKWVLLKPLVPPPGVRPEGYNPLLHGMILGELDIPVRRRDLRRGVLGGRG